MEQEKSVKEINKKDSQENEIVALKAQIEQLQKMILMQQQQMQMNMMQGTTDKKESKKLYDEVTLVHLVEREPGLRTHMKISNLVIDLTKFGEERVLTLQQAEEVISRYRRFFDAGIIALGADAKDVAKRYSLKDITEFNISSELISRLGTMSINELESFYNKLGDGHKKFIVEYWKRQCIKKNPAFYDIYKLEALNRITDGAMEGTLLDFRVEENKKKIAENKAKK